MENVVRPLVVVWAAHIVTARRTLHVSLRRGWRGRRCVSLTSGGQDPQRSRVRRAIGVRLSGFPRLS